MENTKRSPFYKLRRWKYHWQVRFKYRKLINRANRPIKLVVGAGLTEFQDWITTDYPFFDITNRKHWKFLFSKIKPDNLLAEHVMEHLTAHQVEIVFENGELVRYQEFDNIREIANEYLQIELGKKSYAYENNNM